MPTTQQQIPAISSILVISSASSVPAPPRLGMTSPGT